MFAIHLVQVGSSKLKKERKEGTLEGDTPSKPERPDDCVCPSLLKRVTCVCGDIGSSGSRRECHRDSGERHSDSFGIEYSFRNCKV